MSLAVSNLHSLSRKPAIVVCILLLSLGAFSQVNAALEYNLTELVDFSTFLGGTGDDCMEFVSYAFGSTTVDSKGNIIVAGRTESIDFPLKDAFQDHMNGPSDAIISKFYPNGSLIFSTYFGGSAQEVPTDVAVDSEDNIIIAGVTGSPDFPLMNAFQPDFTGGLEGAADCFLTKFSEDGQSLLFSTYFGGTGSDWCYTMNVDSNDRIAISGATESSDFPLVNAHQDARSGSLDIFVSLFEADGQSLLFSTYLGTTGIDHGRRVGFDSQGNVLLTGIVAIGELATEGAYQEEHAGGAADVFLAKLNTNGALAYLTFLGGADNEWGNDLAVDSEDNIVIIGYTLSDDFPMMNSYQAERAEYADMFITKFTPDGQSIVFSTYIGGSSPDYGNSVTVDSQDRIIVTGQTESADFPTTYPLGSAESMYDNVSLVVLDEDGSLLFSMTFGGARDDIGIGVAWHSDDSFIILGYTDSTNFPVYEAYQDTSAGDFDMFIMKTNLQDLIDTTSSTTTSTTSTTGLPPPDSVMLLVFGGAAVAVVVVLVAFVRLRGK
ncbi:MAG: hypothetical protein EAX95_15615 [Candidatus Thorarchaeota archaeon]|nr:hypothetical protein [Candidatus Thorarchaeota archaeon]